MLIPLPSGSQAEDGNDEAFEGPPVAPIVIIDTGSHTTKYGFGGDLMPLEIPSIVGRRKHVPVCILAERYPPDRYVGDDVHGNEWLLRLTSPISGNEVQSWDDVEVIWNHILTSKLKIDSPEEHPLVITWPVGKIDRDAEKLSILTFELFQTPRAFFAPPALLSLLASSHHHNRHPAQTGLVIDSGHAHTTCVPIYAGFPLLHAARSLPIGGREIASHLGTLFSSSSSSSFLESQMDESTLTKIKERFCRVEMDPFRAFSQTQADESATSSGMSEKVASRFSTEQSYTLPDGQEITIGSEAFRAPEPLFAPFLGLAETVRRAIEAADGGLAEELWGGILLTGGNTLLPGFAERLQQDLKRIAPQGVTPRISTLRDPKTAAWRGGSMLSSLSTFRDMCIPYSEYDEYGPVLLRRKCLGIGMGS